MRRWPPFKAGFDHMVKCLASEVQDTDDLVADVAERCDYLSDWPEFVREQIVLAVDSSEFADEACRNAFRHMYPLWLRAWWVLEDWCDRMDSKAEVTPRPHISRIRENQ